MIGRSVALATPRKWASVSRGFAEYTIAGSSISPSRPTRATSLAMPEASSVVYSARATTTGTRPVAPCLAVSRTPALRRGLRHLHTPALLVAGERVVLAHRAAENQAGDAIADQRVDDLRRCVVIDAEIIAELGGDGRENAFPGDRLGHFLLPRA